MPLSMTSRVRPSCQGLTAVQSTWWVLNNLNNSAGPTGWKAWGGPNTEEPYCVQTCPKRHMCKVPSYGPSCMGQIRPGKGSCNNTAKGLICMFYLTQLLYKLFGHSSTFMIGLNDGVGLLLTVHFSNSLTLTLFNLLLLHALAVSLWDNSALHDWNVCMKAPAS